MTTTSTVPQYVRRRKSVSPSKRRGTKHQFLSNNCSRESTTPFSSRKKWRSLRTCFIFIIWTTVFLILGTLHVDLIVRKSVKQGGVHSTRSSFLSIGGSGGVLPPPRRLIDERISPKPSYGLKFRPLRGVNYCRRIKTQDDRKYNDERESMLEDMDDAETYEDVDFRDPLRFDPYDELPYPNKSGCFRLKWTFGVSAYRTCNEFHTFDFLRRLDYVDQQWNIDYIARGHFRQTWMLSGANEDEELVLKTNRCVCDMTAMLCCTSPFSQFSQLSLPLPSFTTTRYHKERDFKNCK